jgi:hypothetical protein
MRGDHRCSTNGIRLGARLSLSRARSSQRICILKFIVQNCVRVSGDFLFVMTAKLEHDLGFTENQHGCI